MSAVKVQLKATEAYQQGLSEVLAVSTRTEPRTALSQAEAQARLEKYGRTVNSSEKPVPRLEKVC